MRCSLRNAWSAPDSPYQDEYLLVSKSAATGEKTQLGRKSTSFISPQCPVTMHAAISFWKIPFVLRMEPMENGVSGLL